jgi:tetratricopeptide (TPR) repeat protein
VNRALNLYALGEPDRARQLYEQAMAMALRVFGGDNHRIAFALTKAGEELRRLGDHTRAREIHEQALTMLQRLYEGDHPHVATALHNLAQDLRGLGDLERAHLHKQALAMRQ